jgi:hypothetical protein
MACCMRSRSSNNAAHRPCAGRESEGSVRTAIQQAVAQPHLQTLSLGFRQ